MGALCFLGRVAKLDALGNAAAEVDQNGSCISMAKDSSLE